MATLCTLVALLLYCSLLQLPTFSTLITASWFLYKLYSILPSLFQQFEHSFPANIVECFHQVHKSYICYFTFFQCIFQLQRQYRLPSFFVSSKLELIFCQNFFSLFCIILLRIFDTCSIKLIVRKFSHLPASTILVELVVYAFLVIS